MELSIIIINWNTREMLRDCLRSVLNNQPGCEFEVIVVDNASTDRSQAMVQAEFPDVQLITNERNLGFAAANNIAMRQAKGAYFLLLNSDTLVHGDVLQRSIDHMNASTLVGVMGCRVLNTDGTLQHSTSEFPSFRNLLVQTLGLDRIRWIPSFRRYRMLDWQRDNIRNVETVSGCFMLVRRKCATYVGLLDEDFFFFGEETDWCRRIRKSGWQVQFAPVGKITHFGGGSSGTLNHRRDLMLTQATVRLHLKHSGKGMAALVFLLLMIFNTSRALYWFFSSFISRAPKTLERRNHFFHVSCKFAAAWPSGKGESI